MRESNNNLKFSVDHARLQFVLRGQPISLISTFLLAVVTIVVMWPGVAHSTLLGWFAVFVAVTLGRATFWFATRSSLFAKKPIAFWRAWFVIGCGLSGVSWGVASQLFYATDTLLQVFMAVVIAGTAAGAITSLASDRWAAFAYVLPCVLPFAIRQLISSNPVEIAIGLVTILFLATIGGSVNRFHAQLALMMTARVELQASEAAVLALNERMQLAASAAKVGVYEWDLITQKVEWDAQVHELWDHDPAEGPATLELWRSRIHPADVAATQARFDEILKHGAEFDLEFRVVARSGFVRDIRSRGHIQRNASGTPIKMIGLVMDVSQLRRLDRMKQEFVSVVSHELRTPLTSIRGALGLLSSAGGTLSVAKNQQLLDLANRNAERLALLIDDILDMDKIESGNMRFELGNHGANDLVAQAIASNQSYAERLAVGFRFHPADQEMLVHVDANRFLQVMNNLLSNSAKFSPQGQSVDVSVERQGSRVRIAVRDYGPGIAKEFQSKIFGKFSQGDSSDSRNKGGSGLGLAISRAIIEIMKGKIGFDSELGKGTTFYVDLPDVSISSQKETQTPQRASIDLMATDPNMKAQSKTQERVTS